MSDHSDVAKRCLLTISALCSAPICWMMSCRTVSKFSLVGFEICVEMSCSVSESSGKFWHMKVSKSPCNRRKSPKSEGDPSECSERTCIVRPFVNCPIPVIAAPALMPDRSAFLGNVEGCI